MDLSEDAARENVEAVVGRAAALGSFVRVDMESSEYTDRTCTWCIPYLNGTEP